MSKTKCLRRKPKHQAPVVESLEPRILLSANLPGLGVPDIDPDADFLLETAGALTVTDPDPGESGFVAETVTGTYGTQIIDATGNWNYEAANTLSSIQQLDAGDSVDDVLTVITADGTGHHVAVQALDAGEILLSVIADVRPDPAPDIQKITTAAAKPTVAMAQTFLQELKSFWQQDSTATGIEMPEVRLRQDFWVGVDRMQQDMDESVEEQAKKMQLSTEPAGGVGISLTAGFVSWALHAGSMVASFLAADDITGTGATTTDTGEQKPSCDENRDTEIDDLFER